MDEYTVAEGSTALFTQVRCQTPGILARGQFKMLLQYHNFRKSIPIFQLVLFSNHLFFFKKQFYRLINHEVEVEGLVGLIKEEVQTDQND